MASGKCVVIQIGSHTATGAGSINHKLGDGSAPSIVGQGFYSTIRHIQVKGIAGGTKLRIDGCMLDPTVEANWETGWIPDTIIDANGWWILKDGPLYIRSYCTTYGSGTAAVYVQHFVER